MPRKTVLVFTLGFSLCVAPQANAEIGTILSQADAAEASRIRVKWDKKEDSGVVLVTGCNKCPLELKITPSTTFEYQGKAAKRKRHKYFSGRGGTVIFDPETEEALKVKW